MDRYDAVIVGGGAMGTAAARSLARRGRSVLLLERSTIGHANGSSGGPTRNFRLTYHDPVYVRMARQALEAWRELESDAEQELMRVVGGLDVGAPTRGSSEALAAAGERFERPAAAEVGERWPMLRFPRDAEFLYQPEGAVVRADETLRAQVRLAARGGAVIREGTRVLSVEPRGEGAVVTAGGEVVQAEVAIVAAGAWAGGLLAGAGINLPLRPTLEQSTSFETDLGSVAIPTVIDWDAAPRQPPYIVPNPFTPGQIKAGAHLSGPVVDPDARSFEPDGEREARVIGWTQAMLSVRASPIETQTCLYTTTPDEDFVLDRIGPIVVASPCTGHGFKFTPLIGEIVADLASNEPPSVHLDRFRVGRPGLRA